MLFSPEPLRVPRQQLTALTDTKVACLQKDLLRRVKRHLLLHAEAGLVVTIDLLCVPKDHIYLRARFLDLVAAVGALRPRDPLVLVVMTKQHGRLLKLRFEQLHVTVMVLALLGERGEDDVVLDNPLGRVTVVDERSRPHVDLAADALVKFITHFEDLFFRQILRVQLVIDQISGSVGLVFEGRFSAEAGIFDAFWAKLATDRLSNNAVLELVATCPKAVIQL